MTDQSQNQHDTNAQLEFACRLRHRRRIDRLDYLRTVSRLAQTMTTEELSRALGVGQLAMNDTLIQARDVEQPVPGFSGANAYEIAERYALGQITRSQLIDELIRYPYAPTPRTDGVDWLITEVPNTLGDVLDARRHKLIDAEIYDAVGEGVGRILRSGSPLPTLLDP